jgi:hypothetical protein
LLAAAFWVKRASAAIAAGQVACPPSSASTCQLAPKLPPPVACRALWPPSGRPLQQTFLPATPRCTPSCWISWTRLQLPWLEETATAAVTAAATAAAVGGRCTLACSPCWCCSPGCDPPSTTAWPAAPPAARCERRPCPPPPLCRPYSAAAAAAHRGSSGGGRW